MGNQKFKLSDMIPNAWFYKLKDMNKPPNSSKKHRLPPPPAPPSSPPETTNAPQHDPQSQPRKSYHFTRELSIPLQPQDPPLFSPVKPKSPSKTRKSTKKQVSGGCTCNATATLQSHRHKPPPENDVKALEQFDIVIDIESCKNRGNREEQSSNGFDFQLPHIVTKPRLSIKKESKNMIAQTPSRRFSVSSPSGGVRLKVNSPKITGRKQGQNGKVVSGRRSVSSMKKKKRRNVVESFAVVKSSNDPQRDFKESMVEMIVQNNLRGSKDLEDLLACYLSLNSDEYHDVIIKVFKQIWFDLSELKHKKLVL